MLLLSSENIDDSRRAPLESEVNHALAGLPEILGAKAPALP